MFTIVAIQNMLVDYSISVGFHMSWTMQVDWQRVDMRNHDGDRSLFNLLEKFSLAEAEDIEDEDDPMWVRPQVKKRKLSGMGQLPCLHSLVSFMIQVKISSPLDFVLLVQESLVGAIGGCHLKMRKLDSCICKGLWWIIMFGFDVPIQKVFG